MRTFILITILITLFFSCKKNETTPMLTWTFKGTTHQSNHTYAEIIQTIYHQINGEENAKNSIIIFTTSFSPGIYYADSTDTLNGAVFSYFKTIDSAIIQSTPAGNIRIDKNENQKLSGTFQLIAEDGNPLSGEFLNIPIQ